MSLRQIFRSAVLLSVLLLSVVGLVSAKEWTVLGPEGGDVRSLAYDPSNPDVIYLGTNTGTMFLSKDGGKSWTRFIQFKNAENYVLDHIVIDPKDSTHMYVAAWSVEDQKAGDIFRSLDGGKTWDTLKEMHGKSVRALAMSASDPKVLAAGALEGVYRTKDGGDSWQRISPPSYAELKNIESIALDPKDPNVVYAGTWHLAWKTPDDGANWHRINNGMIDDSDVFSIIVDATNPSVVFASACSGIYKSETSGDLFHKVQGIPFSARRTRVLKQDPRDPATVYAGTTEGLWKTVDSGRTWKQVTRPDVVVNDVMIDPRNDKRVLLATDRSGVLASNDATQTFEASNHGFSHRYVSTILGNSDTPDLIMVGLVNDQELGGVFESRDNGQHWKQNSSGLRGLDVFSLKRTDTGDLVAGTNRGIYELAAKTSTWKPINLVINEKTTSVPVRKGKKKSTVQRKVATKGTLNSRVNDIEIFSDEWMAATAQGLYTSRNNGKTWTGGPVLGHTDLIALDHNKDVIVIATRNGVLLSEDKGVSWTEQKLPDYVNSVHDVALTPESTIIIAAREGALRSADKGVKWQRVVSGIPPSHISSVSYDPTGERLLATSVLSTTVHESRDGGQTWHPGPDTGYPLTRVSVIHGRMMAATPFDGVIAESEPATAAAATGAASSAH